MTFGRNWIDEGQDVKFSIVPPYVYAISDIYLRDRVNLTNIGWDSASAEANNPRASERLGASEDRWSFI